MKEPLHTLGDGPIEPRYLEPMVELARIIERRLNGLASGAGRPHGFVLLVYPFGSTDGRSNFVSNGADCAQLAVLFREMAARFEGMPEVKPGKPPH